MPDPIVMAQAFAAAAALACIVTLLFGTGSRHAVASAGAVLAVVGGLFAGIWILGLLPHWPPREDLDRLLLMVLPAAALAELSALVSTRAGWALRCVVASLAAPLLLHGSTYTTDLSGPGSRTWSTAQASLIFAMLTLGLLGAWAALQRLAVRTVGSTPLWCIAGATLGAGLVVMLSGYASGGQLGIPFGAALAGVALGATIRKGKPALESALGVGVVGLFALLVVGRLFAELTNVNAALLFAAPLLGWLPELMRTRPRLRAGLGLGLAALPVAVALVLAQQKFAANSRPQPGSAGSLDDYIGFGK